MSYHLQSFLSKKGYIDSVSNELIAGPTLRIGGEQTFKGLDKGWIEMLTATGLGSFSYKLGSVLRGFHTGVIFHYALVLLVGSSIFVLVI